MARTHFCGDGKGAPTSDPLFPVFHAFIEYLRLMHQDCSEFDLVPADKLEDYVPFSYNPTYASGNISLDFVMDFSILCDESNNKMSTICSNTDITPRFVGVYSVAMWYSIDCGIHCDRNCSLIEITVNI